MKPRLNPYQASPDAMKALGALETYVQSCGIEPSLIELVKTRASQINGCAYCIHLHTRDARAHGETEERLYLLSAHFTEAGLVKLTVMIGTINAWNRIAISFRAMHPAKAAVATAA